MLKSARLKDQFQINTKIAQVAVEKLTKDPRILGTKNCLDISKSSLS